MTTELEAWLMLADLILIVHAGIVLFVVGGQIVIVVGWWFGWMWTRQLMFRLLHLAVIGLVMLEAWLGVECPLTIAESTLRAKAGAAGYNRSFISHWLERVVFYTAPEWLFTFIYTVFTTMVIVTWLAYPPRRKYK